MKSFFFSFGWNDTVIINAAVRYSMVEGDRIFLCIPQEFSSGKTDKAIKVLRDFFSQRPNSPSLDVIRVPLRDSYSGFLSLNSYLAKELGDGRTVYVNVSGGMRALLLLLTMAGLVAKSFFPEQVIFMDVDLEEGTYSVRLPDVPFMLMSFDEKKLDLLSYIGEKGSVDAEDLSAVKEISRSTLSRYLDALERSGMVSWSREGKRKLYSLTRVGQTYLDLVKIYRIE